jgi:phosphoglycolate phosphatase
MKCLIFDVFKKRGIKIPKDINELRSLGAREILKKYNISIIDAASLTREYRKRLNKRINDIILFPGLGIVLKKLKKKHTLCILTSNSRENVNVFLENNRLRDTFSFIETGNPLFGKHRRLKNFIKKHGYDEPDVAYVGDEVRDIEAAKKTGIKIIAVSWGYNSRVRLKKENPDYLIAEPIQLLRILD